LLFVDGEAAELRLRKQLFDLGGQGVALCGPGRDAIFEAGIDGVALGRAFNGVRGDGQGALRERSERRVNLFVDLAKFQQRVGVSVQAAGNNVGIEHFKNDAAVMLVVIGQAQQIHHRGVKIGVVGEEISGLGHSDRSHAGADHADESSRDFWLNVSMIPGETGAHNRAETAGGREEKVGITEKSEGRVAIWVRCGTHMQELLTRFINDCPLETDAETGAEQTFRYAGLRIEGIEAGHGFFELANHWRGRNGIALNIHGSGIVEVVAERCGYSGVRNGQI